MRTGRPEHLKGFDYRGGYRYFLTFCTHERRRVFVTAHPVDLVLSQILRTASAEHFDVAAYCFMPDHLHLLIEGAATSSDCCRFVSRAKQFSGFHYQRVFEQRLWQRYGFERTLRSEETTLSAARYIIENPVRARLVKSVREYRFLGSSVYSVEEILDAVQLQKRWCG